MKFSKNLYRTLLIISFLVVNGLVIYGIAAAWNFLNSGADRSTMLHLTGTLEEAYLPKMNWTLENQEGRVMEKQTLKALEEDYRSAWYVRQLAFLNNDSFGLDDFYTEDAREQLYEMLRTNATKNISITATTLEHHPQLKFYSLDGKLAVLTDRNVTSHQEVYQNGELAYQFESKDSYQVILLLEDGFWRIRQMVKIKGEPEEKIPVKKEFQIGMLKGINYYPKAHPWELFGKHFDEQVIGADFEIIADMGFNSLRIFIPYEDFGRAKVHDERLQQLKRLLDLAKLQNLKVLVTLFDFYGNYEVLDWSLTHRHAEQLILALKHHEALLGWDLKNEPDLDFENRGKDNVLNWLSSLSEHIREWDSDHPITIGWSNPEAAIHLHDTVDFVSFHYYGNPKELSARYLALKKEVQNKPLVLQEYGKSSYSGVWNAFLGSEEKQADYFDAMQNFIKEEQLSSFIWTLYDFETIPNTVVGRKPWRKAYQRHYGLMDAEGKAKPAVQKLESQ